MRPTWKNMATAETHHRIAQAAVFTSPTRTRHEIHLGRTRRYYTNLLPGENNEFTCTGYLIGRSDTVACYWD